jgi:hypothetical protein
MRNVIKLILTVLICFNVLAQPDIVNGWVCLYNFSDNLTYQNYKIDKKAFSTNKLEILKTYDIDLNTFEINTDTDQFATLYFPNNTIIKLEQNSEFRIDGFNTTFKETLPYPSRIEVDTYNMNLALMDGEAYFIVGQQTTNDQFFVQTPVSNLGLNKGKYYLQSTKKSAMVYILDGTLEVYDNVTNDKKVVKAGNAVLIHPSAALSPKQMELFGDKMVHSVKKAKPEQFKPYIDVANSLDVIPTEVIFIYVDKKVVAVKVK